MTQTILPVELGGSGHGISWHLANLKCSRRRQLDDEYPDHEQQDIATVAGTIFHAYMAHYYTHQTRSLSVSNVRFEHKGKLWVPVREAKELADRLFEAYRVEFDPTEFGKPAGVEEHFEVKDIKAEPGALPWKPLGVRLTAQMDLIIRLTETKAAKLLHTRGINLEPGLYIVDHKTGSSNPILAAKYAMDIQTRVYQLILQACRPRTPVKGAIINFVSKDKAPKFHTMFVPPPTEVL